MSAAANKRHTTKPHNGRWCNVHNWAPRLVSKKNQNAKIARVFAGGSHTDPGMTEPGTETTLEQGHRHDKAAKPNHG